MASARSPPPEWWQPVDRPPDATGETRATDAHPGHQRRRHPFRGPRRLRRHRPRALRRRLGRGAGIRPVGRLAFALAQRSAAAAAGRRAALRRQRHADRLRDHGRASHPEGPPARPRAVRRQPRPQCRRGRDLFGHGRGRGRRHHPGHPVVCAVASLHVAQRPAAALGHRGEVRPGHHPPRARRRHSARRADQHQLSRTARPAR